MDDSELHFRELFETAKDYTEDGCWIWPNKPMKNGYGAASFNGKHEYAHRASYRLNRGPIPDELRVLHKCDTRMCVRPSHLFLGTASDNSLDMAAKLRSGVLRLTPDDVTAIRDAYENGETQSAIAARYGVAQTTISYACRTGWRWLNGGHVTPRRNRR